MAERRSARTIGHDDDYDDELADDELADSADDELADRDAGLTAAQAAQAALRRIAELTGKQLEGMSTGSWLAVARLHRRTGLRQ